MLKATNDDHHAISLLSDTQAICQDGGFNLTQLGSNSRAVIESIPEEKRMKGMKELELSTSLPVERVLGVSWCIENDKFNFRITLKDKPLTRRGILSSVSSIYDPLGFAAPVMLPVKKLLQSLTSIKLGWDEEVPSEYRMLWEKWRRELPALEQIEVSRCFKPKSFGNVRDATIHHFSDASTIGYGQCSYPRLQNEKGEVSVSFLMGKSRVSPTKIVTIPRLELTAALTSVKVANLLKIELEIVPSTIFFWTDSQVVLGYINNSSKKFHTFVANRVETIRELSEVNQWHYVPSAENPADVASRGMTPRDFQKDNSWLNGPAFLQKDLPSDFEEKYPIADDDPEIKKSKKILLISKENFLEHHLLSRTNDNWHKLKRITARVLRWRSKVKRTTST